MPTLHLIDADSTQACPAVFAAIGAAIEASDDDGGQLLVLGPRALRDEAAAAGVRRVTNLQTRAPFGRAIFSFKRLHRWVRDHGPFDAAHCWSPGAFLVASLGQEFPDRQLSLVHTPDQRWTKDLMGRSNRKKYPLARISADNPVLARALTDAGLTCATEPIACGLDGGEPMPAEDRAALRASWGVGSENERVVVLLSDHPRLTDAVVAAEVAVLGCATLTDDAGELRRVTLLLHPTQPERRRAADFIHHQPVELSVAQDPRVTRPWDVLGACDAAMALGPDAGGLSLRYAAATGLPVIADADGPAGAPAAAFPNIRLARSAAIKDLAHQLHTALSG
jgi:hypothetical protein